MQKFFKFRTGTIKQNPDFYRIDKCFTFLIGTIKPPIRAAKYIIKSDFKFLTGTIKSLRNLLHNERSIKL